MSPASLTQSAPLHSSQPPSAASLLRDSGADPAQPSPPKRQRISRACDACNASRVKCDGLHPCQRCQDAKVVCEYVRARKKRGKASTKDAAARAARVSTTAPSGAAPPAPSPSSSLSDSPSPSNTNAQQSVIPPQTQPHLNQQPLPTPPPPPAPQLPTPAQPAPANLAFNFPFAAPDLSDVLDPAQNSGINLLAWDFSFSTPASPHHQLQQQLQPAEPHSSLSPVAKASPLSADGHTSGYPILHDLFPTLSSSSPSISPALASRLLDAYFQHPPQVLAYLVRPCSILHPTSPRKTRPTLLYAMLCVGAYNCDDGVLIASPVLRARMIQTLFDLCVSALQPLQHGVTAIRPTQEGEDLPSGGGGSLDDVITYVQLGTVLSASEYKGVSLRWWTGAWMLAKELQLGREVEQAGAAMGEEERAERRRTFWLLYMVDRILGLAFNRPLVLLDSECQTLLHPAPENLWQSSSSDFTQLSTSRPRGPTVHASSPDFFGALLPLCTILGMLLDLHHALSHPLIKLASGGGASVAAPAKAQIRSHLDAYAMSLAQLAGSGGDSGAGIEYAALGLHACRLLLDRVGTPGGWDPVLLMDEAAVAELWVSGEMSASEQEATEHAVKVAEAAERVLSSDPGLAYSPFILGPFLLQPSFHLVLVLDKHKSPFSDPRITKACEVLIRTFEVCMATLPSDYQRVLRTIMRGALARAKRGGDVEEERAKRRRSLAYRWHQGGRGLVVPAVVTAAER